MYQRLIPARNTSHNAKKYHQKRKIRVEMVAIQLAEGKIKTEEIPANLFKDVMKYIMGLSCKK